MKYFISFLLGALLHQVVFAQCSVPVVTASGPTSFCPGGSVTLSVPVGNTWAQKADFGGSARYEAVGFSIGNKGYIGTGAVGNFSYLKDFWEYDPATNAWTQKADFGGTARHRAVGFSIGSKGYIGTGGESTMKKDFWEYNPATNTWAQKADFGGTARAYATGFSIGSKGYIGTGSDGNVKKDFWEYDPATNIWAQKADFGGTAVFRATGLSIGNKGYMGTGSDGSNLKKDFWEYNPATNTWLQKADFGGTARSYATSLSIGSKGYIGTGNDGNFKKDFWEYNPTVNTWTQKSDFGNTERYNAVGFSIGGKGFIGTGLHSPNGNNTTTKDFWEYDPDYTYTWLPGGANTSSLTVTSSGNYTVTTTNAGGCSATSAITTVTVNTPATPAVTASGPTSICPGGSVTLSAPAGNVWTQKANFGGGARTDATGFSIGSKGYIGTGCNGSTTYKDFWEYDPATNVWTQKADFGGAARNGATSFCIGTKGYIGTGANGCAGGTFFKDFWEYNPSTNVWIQKADFGGAARAYATGFSIGSKGYIGIGNYGISGSKDFWEYDPLTNVWIQKADFGGAARIDATGFCIGSKGYIGTGLGSSGPIYKDFWEYNPSTNVWTQKADFGGAARYGTAGFSVGSKGYIGLGNGSNGTYTDFWEYAPITDIWTQKADFSGAARFYSTSFSIGSKGYIGIGYNYGSYYGDFREYDPGYTYSWSPSGQTTPSITVSSSGSYTVTTTNVLGCSATSAATEVTVNTPVTPIITTSGPTTFCPGGSITLSAPVGNTWTQKADISNAVRQYATGFCIGSKGYIGTGATNNTFYKDFWEYDPATNVWTQKADFGGTARYGATSFSIGSKGYISSGYNNSIYYKDLWEYDPAANTWTQKADFGGAARYNATAFSIASKGYIGTGVNSTGYLKDFWEYDPAANVWTQKTDFGGAVRGHSTSLSISSKGYIGTGINSSGYLKDFWEYNPSTNTWTQKADFGGGLRYGATGFTIGTKGYIGTGVSNNDVTKDFWEFNPSTNIWTQKADFGGVKRAYATSLSIGGKGYIGTGYNGMGGFTKDFWEYDPGYTYAWSPGGQTTSSITANAAGNYSVTATNVFGCSATSSATTVTVKPATQITTQPQSITTCKGSSVSFSVTATGSNLIYKWFRNGQSISNNAATLTISNAQASNSGSYTVDVIGDCGTVTSAAATLLVYDNNNGAIYVDNGVSASGSGASWATAYKELREALNAASQCSNITTINVAKGTYKPANNTNRDSAFTILRGGLKIYGGYPSGGGTRSITANPTILSGDIGTSGNNSDNSYHVLVIAGLASSADSLVIDGFTITGGNANGTTNSNYATTPTYQGNGGGAYIINNANGRKIALRNLTVSNNAAGYVAGGFEINNSSPFIANCTFSGNSGGNSGGGIFNEVSASPLLINCLFVSNSVSGFGGGIYNQSTSAPAVTNCTFYANSSGGGGGAMRNNSASPLINSCIIWGNTGLSPGISDNSGGTVVKYSLVQGLSGGTGNINTNPLFVNTLDADGADNIWGTSDDGLKLQAGSPAINTGSNQDIPAGITTDITGAARIQNGTVDMGAYEGSTVILPLTLLQFKGTAINSKDALLNWRTSNEVNTSHFELQRSTDSRSFSTIATLQAKGTVQSQADYSYTDKNLPAGLYYYRLKMVDKDGKEAYSAVVIVVLKSSSAITLYPVPAKDFVWLSSNTNLPGISATLMDIQGRILQIIRISQWPQRVDVSTLAAGTYLIKVENEQAMPFIKQ